MKYLNTIILGVGVTLMLIISFCPDNTYTKMYPGDSEAVNVISTGDCTVSAEGNTFDLRNEGTSVISGTLITGRSYEDLLSELTSGKEFVYESDSGNVFVIGEDSIAIIENVSDNVQALSYTDKDLMNALAYYDQLHFCPEK